MSAIVLTFKNTTPKQPPRDSPFIKKAKLLETCAPEAAAMVERLIDDLSANNGCNNLKGGV